MNSIDLSPILRMGLSLVSPSYHATFAVRQTVMKNEANSALEELFVRELDRRPRSKLVLDELSKHIDKEAVLKKMMAPK